MRARFPEKNFTSMKKIKIKNGTILRTSSPSDKLSGTTTYEFWFRRSTSSCPSSVSFRRLKTGLSGPDDTLARHERCKLVHVSLWSDYVRLMPKTASFFLAIFITYYVMLYTSFYNECVRLQMTTYTILSVFRIVWRTWGVDKAECVQVVQVRSSEVAGRGWKYRKQRTAVGESVIDWKFANRKYIKINP